jgi:hypothetical protein
MAIRKFIEEIGEKILPAPRKPLPVARQQQQQPAGARPAQQGGGEPRQFIWGVGADESAQAVRRYLQTRRDFVAPSDLVVIFDETDGVVILGGTVRDEPTRELIIQAAGNIHGVERVDDRMVTYAEAGLL